MGALGFGWHPVFFKRRTGEVMIQMFVRQDGPLVWREAAEEAMGMGGASFGSGGGEAVYEFVQAFAFFREVALVRDSEFLRGRGIAADGFVVTDHVWLDETADDSQGERR
jgi:hypothetical protein